MYASKILATLAAGATLLASLPASAQPVRFEPQMTASPLLTDVQWRDGRHWRGDRAWHGGRHWRGGRHWYGGRHWRGPGYRHPGWNHRGWRTGGVALGAGVAGLATGALLGGVLTAQASPAYGYDPADPAVAPAPAMADTTAYCTQRFRSYDPGSGTYLGYDGLRHPCP